MEQKPYVVGINRFPQKSPSDSEIARKTSPTFKRVIHRNHISAQARTQ